MLWEGIEAPFIQWAYSMVRDSSPDVCAAVTLKQTNARIAINATFSILSSALCNLDARRCASIGEVVLNGQAKAVKSEPNCLTALQCTASAGRFVLQSMW